MKVFLRFLVFVSISVFGLGGCVTYRDYPDSGSESNLPAQKVAVTYRYEGSPGMFGGGPGLKETLRDAALFSSIERVQQRVDKGLFIDLTVNIIPPSVPAIAFGYLSFSTLTLLPAWSTQDGYEILFDVYRDGERVRSFDYSFRRGSFVWLPMVLLIWVNAMTPSEELAFSAVAEQFMRDAAPYF